MPLSPNRMCEKLWTLPLGQWLPRLPARRYVWTASSRDEAVPALTGVAGRLARALQNFIETFPLFAAAVLIAHVAATHSWMTEWGVQLYFWGRVAYIALFAAGVFLLLSIVCNVLV